MDQSIQVEQEEEINKLDQTIEKFLPTDKVLSTIAESLDANKTISCNVIHQSGEGMADANSMTKDFIDVPDWGNRLKAADMASRMKGMYPPEKKKIEAELDISHRMQIIEIPAKLPKGSSK